MSVFEIGMLACFGFSWPFSIAKSLRTKKVEGKSPAFMVIVMVGYLCGITHKFLYNLDWVVGLYALDLVLVLADFILYMRYRPRKEAAA
ncbi:MAG: hypothetical protein J5985_01920 [Kiritimatiellae bacterium]|nr:hypothetical protein [Kiritimatiellia bacterium]